MKKALDRSIGAVLPYFARIGGEVHHAPRYMRYPSLLAVGVANDDDDEERHLFSTLVDRNAINFHAPAHAAGVVLRTAPHEEMWAIVGGLVAIVAGRERGAA